MPTCSRRILILSFGLLHAALALSGTQEAGVLKVTHAERSVAPGEIMLFRVQSPKAMADLRATAFAREFRMFSESGADSWIGLVGIDMDTRPGTYAVEFHGVDKSGQPLTSSERINVISKSFPKRMLTVDPKFVNPPPEVMDRIRQESERVRIIFESTTAERYWRGKFVVPVPGPVISDFGKRSVYNGQQRSSHAGTDFRGATGTPIHAPNTGRVVLAADLYYSGNTVIIDHGLGLYTYFGHMSEFGVKEGERVERGAVVGKVGATGLVTGPHLHWTIRLAGTRVDPVSLLDLPEPVR